MATEKTASAGSITVAPGEPKIKMVKRHSEYQEPDVEANQAVSDENRFTGKNPYPAGTERHKNWEYLKQLGK